MTTNEELCSYSIGQTQLKSDVILGLLLSVCLLLFYVKLCDWNFFYHLRILLEFAFSSVPRIQVELPTKRRMDCSTDSASKNASTSSNVSLSDPLKPGFIQCFDPSTLQHLGQVTAMTSTEVNAVVTKAAAAQPLWSRTSFAQRRKLLRTLQKYITEYAEDICHISAMDSGKTKVDALLGTCIHHPSILLRVDMNSLPISVMMLTTFNHYLLNYFNVSFLFPFSWYV
jgi:hypothetical protein